MTHLRLAYDDADTTHAMSEDCSVALRMHLPAPARREVDLTPAPSILFEHFPQDVAKPEIAVSEAAARLAARFQQG